MISVHCSLFTVHLAYADRILVPADYVTIQGGIEAASNGDTVLVASGTYFENINYRGKAITVASLFIIDGDTNHINSTIIDGSLATNPDSASVVYFINGEDTTSILQGFTITGGTGTLLMTFQAQVGAGIYAFNSGCKILYVPPEPQHIVDSFRGTYSKP